MSNSGGINNEMIKLAEYASATAKEKFRCTLDFSEGSLVQLEALLDQAYKRFSQLEKEGTLRGEIVQKTANVWGSYLGEVIRRKWGGTWRKISQQTTLTFKNGNSILPIGFVLERITQKPNYGVVEYYADSIDYLKRVLEINPKNEAALRNPLRFDLPEPQTEGSPTASVDSESNTKQSLTTRGLLFLMGWIGCIVFATYSVIHTTPRTDLFTGIQHPNIWDVIFEGPILGTVLFFVLVFILQVLGGLGGPSTNSQHIPSSVRRRSRR